MKWEMTLLFNCQEILKKLRNGILQEAPVSDYSTYFIAAQCSPNYVGSQRLTVVNGSFCTIRSALFKFRAL